jgi:hypothetical protein
MLFVFVLAVVLAVPAIWLRNQIASTDRYVRTVSRLASDPAVQTALSDRVTTLISAQFNEIVARDGLIERDFLRAPLLALLEDYVNRTVRTFITSDRFLAIWERINRAAHPMVSALLTDRGTRSVSTTAGEITLDLTPLIDEVVNRLRERGVTLVDRIARDRLDTTFVMYRSAELADAQAAVRLLGHLAIWLPALALVSLGAALILAVDRRRAFLWGGVSLAGTTAIVLMLLALARWWTIARLPTGVNRDAATAFFNAIGRSPRAAWLMLGLLGGLMAVLALRAGALRRRRGL